MFPGCITVGAYNTRSNFVWYGDGKSKTVANTKVGDINKYSGYGIDRQGVSHPTIAAPGAIIGSGVSNYHDKYLPTAPYSNMLVDIVNKDGRDNRYAMMQGTSMAAPCVAGIIALWLEANPQLTPDDVKNILQLTATHDKYTDAAPMRFGFGKINAYEGAKQCDAIATDIAKRMADENDSHPIVVREGGEVKVLLPASCKSATVDVLSADGRVVSHGVVNGQSVSTFALPSKNAIYVIRVKGNGCYTKVLKCSSF